MIHRVRPPEPGLVVSDENKARDRVRIHQQSHLRNVDPTYGTTQGWRSAVDSPAQAEEKERITQVAREVNVGTTHLYGTHS